MAASSTVKPHS
ncbi:hypothetical protein D046_8253A, partial [Vibrio parahaemolyticus V-223/04]